MKIIAMNFQRNGVSGEPFYVATFNKLDDGTKGNFIATFQVNNEDTYIDSSSCRVVEYGNPFEASGMKRYYELIIKLRESAKN